MSNPFDEVKQIFAGEDFKLKNPWMVNRILSYIRETLYLSIRVNQFLGRLPTWAVECIYKACIKKGSMPHINYAKIQKKKDKQLTERVSTHLCCSEHHAQQTIELLRLKGTAPEKLFGLKKGE